MKGGLLRESCVSACASADVSGDLCKYNVCVVFLRVCAQSGRAD